MSTNEGQCRALCPQCLGGEPAVVEIAAGMPDLLRHMRGIALLGEVFGPCAEVGCPACEGGIIGHDGIVPIPCPVCRCTALVPLPVRTWFSEKAIAASAEAQNKALARETGRSDHKPHPTRLPGIPVETGRRSWGRMAESGGSPYPQVPLR